MMVRLIFTLLIGVLFAAVGTVQQTKAQKDKRGAAYALNFDGSNDYVTFPDNLPFEVPMDGTSDFTISFWLNLNAVSSTDDQDYPLILRKNTQVQIVPVPGGGTYKFGVYDGSSWQNVKFKGQVANQWVHYTAVFYSGGDMVAYQNGEEINRLSAGITNIPDKGQGNTISKATWDNKGYLNGTIDELCIWDRALSQSEIQQHMTQRLTGSEPGLVGYWRFDEGSGTTVNDDSGNSNDGILQ